MNYKANYESGYWRGILDAQVTLEHASATLNIPSIPPARAFTMNTYIITNNHTQFDQSLLIHALVLMPILAGQNRRRLLLSGDQRLALSGHLISWL